MAKLYRPAGRSVAHHRHDFQCVAERGRRRGRLGRRSERQNDDANERSGETGNRPTGEMLAQEDASADGRKERDQRRNGPGLGGGREFERVALEDVVEARIEQRDEGEPPPVAGPPVRGVDPGPQGEHQGRREEHPAGADGEWPESDQGRLYGDEASPPQDHGQSEPCEGQAAAVGSRPGGGYTLRGPGSPTHA